MTGRGRSCSQAYYNTEGAHQGLGSPGAARVERERWPPLLGLGQVGLRLRLHPRALPLQGLTGRLRPPSANSHQASFARHLLPLVRPVRPLLARSLRRRAEACTTRRDSSTHASRGPAVRVNETRAVVCVHYCGTCFEYLPAQKLCFRERHAQVCWPSIGGL